MTSILRNFAGTCAVAIASSAAGNAQGTLADYQRAKDSHSKARGLVVNALGPVNWIDESDHFWYWRSVKGGFEFILVDAANSSGNPTFDHARLAATISSASRSRYTALALPFAPPQDGPGGRGAAGGPPQTAPLTFLDHDTAIQFGTGEFLYKCALTDYARTNGGRIPAGASAAPLAMAKPR